MAYLYVLSAGLLTAISNLFVRRSVDLYPQKNVGDPFVIQRLIGAACFALALILMSSKMVFFEKTMFALGCVGGLMLGSLMWTIGKTLKEGSSALSLAIINSACVIPPIVMALLFGTSYGHEYSLRNAVGAIVVLIGIFWMTSQESNQKFNRIWLFWVISGFTIHALFLIFFQWRALLFKMEYPLSWLLPFHCEQSNGECFTLALFMTAAASQLLFRKDSLSSQYLNRQSIQYGILGGMINGLGSFLLVKGTETAQQVTEKVWIFPLYCIGLIYFCSLWGKWLYQENIHWPATLTCLTGILIGMI